jgi:hypothetical protein
MSLQQLDPISNLLKMNATMTPASYTEMRAGFEQMVSIVPIDPFDDSIRLAERAGRAGVRSYAR